MRTLYYRCEKDSPEMPVKSPKAKEETEVGVAKKEKKVKKKIQREPESSGGSEQVWGHCHVTYDISHVTDTSKAIHIVNVSYYAGLYRKPNFYIQLYSFCIGLGQRLENSLRSFVSKNEQRFARIFINVALTLIGYRKLPKLDYCFILVLVLFLSLFLSRLGIIWLRNKTKQAATEPQHSWNTLTVNHTFRL